MAGDVAFDRRYVFDLRSTERPRRSLALTNVRLKRSQAMYMRRHWRLAAKHRRGLHVHRAGLWSIPPWAA